MRYSSAKNQRVLAIDPYTQGFGFAVLEGPKWLIDYGIKKVRGDKNSACLRKLADLIERYQPTVVVLENMTDRGARRCLRVQELTQEVFRLAFNKRVKAQSISRRQIRKAFSSSGAFTKHQIANSIAKQLPELALRLPPVRKLWMREDERMSIFDAIALALTLLLAKPNGE